MTDPDSPSPAAAELPGFEELPGPVRHRVVAEVASVLPEVSGLSPALRRVAGFIPAQRAKAGAAPLAAALAGAEAEKLRHAVASRRDPADLPADPAGRAALVWLIRPASAAVELARALGALVVAGAEQNAAEDRADRLQHRLRESEEELLQVRAEGRTRIEELKKANSDLRRKLGRTREQLRAAAAEPAAEDELRTEREARREAEELAAVRGEEIRRLQQELERASTRRQGRAERDEVTARARVLLDTLVEATAGLRRELALPPTERLPADSVEAEVARRTGESADRLDAVRTATHLDAYLSMPRARLIIDGYNVTKSLWPRSSLEAQRLRLLQTVAPVVARSGAETTVVFDAAESDARPPTAAPRGVRVLFSPRGVIADQVIVDLVAAEPSGRVVLVVSDDQEVADSAARDGARPVPVDVFAARLQG